MPDRRFYTVTFELEPEQDEDFKAFELELNDLLLWAGCENIDVQNTDESGLYVR